MEEFIFMDQLNKLYVGNFPYNWSEDDLERVFIDFKGHITDIKIVYDKFSGRSKGFAFVTFDSKESAENALNLGKIKAGDRDLVVSVARPQMPREGGFESRGGAGGGFNKRPNSRSGGGFDRGAGRSRDRDY